MMDIFAMLFVAVLVIGPICLFFLGRLKALQDRFEDMEWKFRNLENRIEQNLRTQKVAEPEPVLKPLQAKVVEKTAAITTPASLVPPPLPTPKPAFHPPVIHPEEIRLEPQSQPPPVFTDTSSPAKPQKVVDWEKFLGVNLFAWIGGLALFLGVCFFVKYSFEHNLISPAMRVALGYLVGLGLVAGGIVMRNKNYAVTSQTLCATGIVVLYGVSFAAHGLYHLFNSFTAFAVMTLVTAGAFFMAVRMDAKVVAVLGVVGAFLTPPLLSTGVDNPLGLFGYITLLQLGLLAITFRKAWHFLVLLGAIGTALMEIGWFLRFFSPEKLPIALNILFLFNVLAVGAYFLFERLQKGHTRLIELVCIQAGVTFIAVAFFLGHAELRNHPGPVLVTLLLADLALLALPLARSDLFRTHAIAGSATFLLLTVWVQRQFDESRLYWALGATLLFALLHSVYPLILQRKRQIVTSANWANLFPLAGLALLLLGIFRMENVSFLIWPVVLLLNLLIIALAFVTASLFVALAAVVMTAILSAAWIFRVPPDFSETGLLGIIALFAVVFIAGGLWLLEKGAASLASDIPGDNKEFAKFIPASGALLPFMLLGMILLRFKVENPSEIFALIFLLDLGLLWLGRRMKAEALDLAALCASISLQFLWYNTHCTSGNALLGIAWFTAFFVLFLAHPFVFRRNLLNQSFPWIVSALAGPIHFFLIYNASKKILVDFPAMGLIPAAMAVPVFLALQLAIKRVDLLGEKRDQALSLLGGSALFFITFIFPIQFEKQWITIGWALEGLSLIWLYRKLPQQWLSVVGIFLLLVAFARLGLNLAVFNYHPRSEVPILNWYLYSYGLVTICLLLSARILAPPRNLVLGTNAPPLLYTLGTILAFILLNIQIADFFSTGNFLTFEFSTRLDRDMTYSIAWALFALGLLLIGIHKELKAVRYSAMGLIGVTLLKLFFHDLSHLGQLYRVGAFMGVAIILIVASWLYQRYLASIGQNNAASKT